MDDLSGRIRELRERRGLLQRSRAEIDEAVLESKVTLVDQEHVFGYLQDFRNTLAMGSLAEQRRFLRLFVERIVKLGTEVTAHDTLPLPTEDFSLEHAAVLDWYNMVGGIGVEPMTSAMSPQRSNQLS